MPLTAPHPHRPRALARLRPLALAALVAFAPSALAQQAQEDAARGIEDRMTATEFREAGLDQLSPEQLASLNAWLERELTQETRRAAEKAVQWIGERTPVPAPQPQQQPEPMPQDDGLFNFGSDDEVTARIAGRFTGFAEGRRYTLDNGQVWEQIDSTDLPGVELDSPVVEISPSVFGNSWYIQVEGYNTRAKVRRVK